MAKTYEYRIVRGEVCSPFEWPYVHHHPYPLDEERMARLRPRLRRRARFHAPSPPPTIAMPKASPRCARSSLPCWSAAEGRLIYRVRGSGFLKHMVRNMVGTLIEARQAATSPT